MMAITPHRVADDEARAGPEDELIGRTSSKQPPSAASAPLRELRRPAEPAALLAPLVLRELLLRVERAEAAEGA